MRRTFLSIAAIALASATSATAMEMVDFDINGDGFATMAEIDQLVGGFTPSDFNKLDSNNDNRLSIPELQAPGSRGIIARYEGRMIVTQGITDISTDGDRFATQAELAAAYPGLTNSDFNRIDTNNDNRVNSVELYAPRAQAVLHRHEMAPDVVTTIMQVDSNDDNFATYEELRAVYPNLSLIDFRKIDTNDDNRLNSREYYMSDAQIIFDQSGS